MSGVIFDSGGQRVAAATVTISGDRMLAARTAQTQADGTYNLQLLLPGTYKSSVSISLVQNSTQVQARYYPDQASLLSRSTTWGSSSSTTSR